MRRLLSLLAALAATSAVVAASAGQAAASTVHCGDVITRDTALDADLTCSGDGIVIGASNVTLDLNGHTISGQLPDVIGDQRGITTPRSIDSPYLDVPPLIGIVIKGGSVRGFGSGYGAIFLRHAEASIAHMRLTDNGNAVSGASGTLTFHDNIVSANGGGLFLSEPSEIHANVVANNQGGAMYVTHAGPVTVSDNVIEHNGFVKEQIGQPQFPAIFAYESNLEITHNRIIDNRYGGIASDYAVCAAIQSNVVSGNGGDGISRGPGCDEPVSNNVIKENDGNGITQTNSRLTADNNLITKNARSGVFVEGDGSGFAPPSATLTDNTVSQNALDGIHIGQDTLQNTLDRNNADRNGHDGIEVENTNTSVTRNHTWFNGNLGIEAVPGTSGSDNWAKHNGNHAQCVPTALCSTTGKPKN